MSGSNLQLPLDHLITITTSEDKLKAYLLYSNPENIPFHWTLSDLEQLLQANHIQHGIHYDLLTDFVSNPKKHASNKFAVAVGDQPMEGKDGHIHYVFHLEGNRKPAELEDGTVDFKQVVSLNNVRKGQLIAERIPPTEGIPGRAVTGETLFAKTGKEARFKLGKNVVTDPEQKALYAAIDGLVTITDKDKINVFPVYEVNGDVDYKVGNIEFVGTVVIRGNVLTGFSVKADGDIRVTGGVEGAELEAGGSIDISAGVLGHNKGLIKAGKNVKSSFIQEGNVEAGQDIIVSQSIMHSQIRASRDVICSGSKGLIVGGIVQAGEAIQARIIGNTMSTVTVTEVGVLPELRNELLQLKNDLKTITENMDKTEKAINLLDQMAAAGQLAQDKLAMRIRLNSTKRQSLESQNTLRERILEIEKSLEDTDKAKVLVMSTIYGGTKIVIGRYTRYIKDSVPRTQFKLVDGEIAMLPL